LLDLGELPVQDLQSGQCEAARLSVEKDFAEFAKIGRRPPAWRWMDVRAEARRWRYEPEVDVKFFVDSALDPEVQPAVEDGFKLLNGLFVKHGLDLILDVETRPMPVNYFLESQLDDISDENGSLLYGDVGELDLVFRGRLLPWNMSEALVVAINRKIVGQSVLGGGDTKVMGIGHTNGAFALIAACEEKDMDLIRQVVAHEVLHLLELDSHTQSYDRKGHCYREPCLMNPYDTSDDLCSSHVIGMQAYYESMINLAREKAESVVLRPGALSVLLGK
jgi:hypothetical protein